MKSLFDLIFDHELTDTDTSLDGYNFYTVTPDNKYLYFRSSGFIEKYDDFLESISRFLDWDNDFYYYVYKSIEDFETVFLDYDSLKPLFGITIEGSVDEIDNGVTRNQFVAIRGTCDHKCPEHTGNYSGYALWELPSCDRKYVGTTVWTRKYATVPDFLIDITYWLRYCKGLDVLVVNFDITPEFDFPKARDLKYKNVCFCVLVRGSNIRFVTKVQEIKSLYLEYSHKYWCMDYEIEESMTPVCYKSDRCSKFRYLADVESKVMLEKPSGSKE